VWAGRQRCLHSSRSIGHSTLNLKPHLLTDTRLTRRFDQLRVQKRGGLITFLTAGDPNFDTSMDIVKQLPEAGADIIELGMPFSDPMADGPAIQTSSQRALAAGMTLTKVLMMVDQFRATDEETPIILMGYFNPIYQFGINAFLDEAANKGVDGLIIVDLPPEEDDELCQPALAAGLHWIRLVTPTTNDDRLSSILRNASGFLYYVSIAGITGTTSPTSNATRSAVNNLRRHTSLPIAVGFGIRTPEQVQEVANYAEAAVVGSALVSQIARNMDKDPDMHKLTNEVLQHVIELSTALEARVKS